MKRSGYHSEELLSRLTSDIQAVTGGVVQVAVSLSAVTLQFVMAFLVLWNMDRSLAVFAVVTGPCHCGIQLYRREKDQKDSGTGAAG